MKKMLTNDNANAMEVLSFENVRTMLGERSRQANKGDNGKGLVIAGSQLMSGAALMCAAAALRSGIGTIKAIVPDKARPAFYALPECMCISFGNDEWSKCDEKLLQKYIDEATAICVGPGIGQGEGTAKLVRLVLRAKKPAVVDADGLNALSGIEDKAEILHENVILTPHIGEMARLTGAKTDDIKSKQAEFASEYAGMWGCTVLLKSYRSYVADQKGRLALNQNGNSGLAKGGSGDVLSGIALAMLGQRLGPFESACAAAYILGASADEAFGLLKERMLMARDVTDAVEQTVGKLFR